MSDGTFSNLPNVDIDGVPLTNTLAGALGACWIENSVNLPAAFHLTFRGSPQLLLEQYGTLLRVGAMVSIYAVADGQGRTTPLLTGSVTAVEAEYDSGEQSVILRGMDHAFKMLRVRRATGYQNMTAAEIVADLAARDGVETSTIEPTTPVYEQIVQPNVSDWEFVNYLADQSDMEVDFDDLGLLRFRSAKPAVSGVVVGDAEKSPYALEFGANMVRCRAAVTASDQVTRVMTYGWSETEKLNVTGSATATLSRDLDIGTTPDEVMADFGPSLLTETGTPYGTMAQADRAAQSLAADITSAFGELELEVRGEPSIVPGVVVELQKAGQPFNGKYTVTTTRHVFDQQNGYSTWVWVTGRQVRTLYGLAAGGGMNTPRINGVVNAIVTDINDPMQQGRVKLRFPWFDYSYVSGWARTVQYGGLHGGGLFSPEVNDEVLVAFDRGSMDYPYVIGGLYSNPENSPNKHDIPPVAAGHVNVRSFETRTGNRVELLSAEGETGVRLTSGNDELSVYLDETNNMISIVNSAPAGVIDVTSKGMVNVQSSSGGVTVKSFGPVSVASQAAVSVTAATDVSVSSGAAVTVNAGGAVNVSAEGAVSVEAIGALNLDALEVNVTAATFTIEGMLAVTGDITMDGQQVLAV